MTSESRLSVIPADESVPVLDVTVGEVLRTTARESPEVVGLTDLRDPSRPRRWTYAEFLGESEEIARGMLARFRPGERVVVWSANSTDWVLMEFALAHAGIVLVTANPASTEAELRYIVEQSKAVGLVFGTGNSGRSLEDVARTVGTASATVREVIALDRAPRGSSDRALPDVSPDDPVQIQFTSGTTGRPKGAILRHRAVANVPRFYAIRSRVEGPGGWISPFPLFHTGGCVTGTLVPVWLTLNNVVLGSFDPARMLAALQEEQVVGTILVPTMASMIMDATGFGEADLHRLQHVGIGSAAVSPEMIRRCEAGFGAPFANTFGQTEASPIITSTRPDADARHKALSVGQALPQVELQVLGPDGRPTVLGVVGEICIRGYQVMIGYDDLPDATAATIDEHGILHTGDLGRLDEDGYLYVEGRLKDMIIKGGENIYPQEIEFRLAAHPRVATAVVVGRADATYGEVPEAIVVPVAGGAVPTAGELRAWCRDVLQTYKLPAAWFVAESLPVLASGKVPKHEVLARHRNQAYPPLAD